MTRHETAIAERLRDAAGRIPVDADPGAVVDRPHRTVVVGRRRPWIAAVGVAAAVVAALAAVAVRLGPDADTGAVEAGRSAPVGGSDSYAPHLESPPEWFGEPRGAEWNGAVRTGRWVSMAIGRETDDGVYNDTIVISAFDGGYARLATAESVVIDGEQLRSIDLDGWRLLATEGSMPTIMVSGSEDEATLAEVLSAVEVVVDPDGKFSLHLPTPDGFTELAPPTVLGLDAPWRRVLASGSGDTAIGEGSDWIDPLLAAANTGAGIRFVDIDGNPGWLGRVDDGQFLIWSPQPGVLFVISTNNPDRAPADLEALAEATTAIPPEEWDDIYD